MSSKVQLGIRCLQCGDAIYSKYTHDFKWCKCDTVAVDGGPSYLRIVGEPYNFVVIDKEGNPYEGSLD